jgi:hypothetical protein
MEPKPDERRLHKRHKLKCPITLFGLCGQVLAKTSTLDISQGGTYVTVAQNILDDIENVNVTFSIPSTAPNNQIEGFATNATVLRQGQADHTGQTTLALQFTQQLHLPLET